MAYFVDLKTDKLSDLRRVAGVESDAELARRMGVSQSSLMRVLRGDSKPGVKFLAGLCAVFGGEQWFEKLFIIVKEPGKPKK